MTPGIYLNHQHYISDGWSAQPKDTFKALLSIIGRKRGLSDLDVLDVGCATGELIGYLADHMSESRFSGIDVTEDLLKEARRLAPFAQFSNASALDLPADFARKFDVVCAIGCMSIFDETEIGTFWDNLVRSAKPGGLIVVLSPLNEHGIDAVIRHRKRIGGRAGEWETGWNVYCVATVQEIVNARGARLELEPFQISFDLPPKPDPIRTWTMATPGKPRQLTNGLKLLIDHYFMIAETGRS